MITDWRQQFNNFRMGFYFVLLAAFKEGGFPTWPEIRDAQLAALALPYTGVSSAQDLGDETGPAGAVRRCTARSSARQPAASSHS